MKNIITLALLISLTAANSIHSAQWNPAQGQANEILYNASSLRHGLTAIGNLRSNLEQGLINPDINIINANAQALANNIEMGLEPEGIEQETRNVITALKNWKETLNGQYCFDNLDPYDAAYTVLDNASEVLNNAIVAIENKAQQLINGNGLEQNQFDYYNPDPDALME